MHQNPFSPAGYDHSHLERQLQNKAGQYEVTALRSTLDRLERSIDMARQEHRAEIDGLRARCEQLEKLVLELNPGALIPTE